MKKRTALRAGAALILILLCASYGFSSWRQTEARNLEETISREIFVTDLGPVSGFSIEKDGRRLTFSLEGGTWYCSQDHEASLNQETVRTLANLLSRLPALEMIENPDSLETYGLADPALSFEITTADSTAALLIGNALSDENQYYACISGGTLVYTIGPQLMEMASMDLSDYLTE